MKRKLSGLLVNVKNGIVKRKEIDDTLESLYYILDCDTIDIVNRKIGNHRYEIVCDDEALLKDEAIPSAMKNPQELMLFGNLFIVNEADGNLTSLAETDFFLLEKNIVYVTTLNHPNPFPMIKNMDY